VKARPRTPVARSLAARPLATGEEGHVPGRLTVVQGDQGPRVRILEQRRRGLYLGRDLWRPPAGRREVGVGVKA
jgi:hypothetical protein